MVAPRFQLPLPVFELVGEDQRRALTAIALGVVAYLRDMNEPAERRIPNVALALARHSNISASEALVGIQYGLRNGILSATSSDGPLTDGPRATAASRPAEGQG